MTVNLDETFDAQVCAAAFRLGYFGRFYDMDELDATLDPENWTRK